MRLIDADLIQYEPMLSAKGNGMYEDVMVAYKSQIDDLPTIEERKKGKWEHLGGDEWCCNQCGNVIHTEGHWEHPLSNDRKMYHCNICGADMRGEQDE